MLPSPLLPILYPTPSRRAARELTPQNPFNWPPGKKYANTLVPLYICLLTSLNATSPGIMAAWGPAWFGTTRLGFAASGTAYLVSFAVASLLTAPLSELFGRRTIYQVATALSALLFVPQALTRSVAVLLVVRTLVSASLAVLPSLACLQACPQTSELLGQRPGGGCSRVKRQRRQC